MLKSMLENLPQPYRFSVSNANLSPLQAVTWGADQHHEYVDTVGADGIEWMPVRGRMRLEAEIGRKSMTGLVTSLHASFRTATVGDVVKGHESPRELKFIAALSQLGDSYPLVTMQSRVGYKLPIVVYPNEQEVNGSRSSNHAPRQVDYRLWRQIFAGTRFQPTAELLHNWQVLSSSGAIAMEGMKAAMAAHGLDAVCFDTYHWTSERGGHVMPDWSSSLPSIAADGTLQEMHICPARTDMGGDDRQLQQILRGHIAETEIGDMIASVRENTPRFPGLDIVLELPSEATGGDVGVTRAVISAIRQQFETAA